MPELDLAYVKLVGRELVLGGFRLKLWREIANASVVIGQFEHGTMWFENGASCWHAGRQRSAAVVISCANVTARLPVIKVRQCHYEAVLPTPAACERANIDVLPDAMLEQLEETDWWMRLA
jgi:hypothetical protein